MIIKLVTTKLNRDSFYHCICNFFNETKLTVTDNDHRFVNEKSIYLPDRSDEMRCAERWKNDSQEVSEFGLVKVFVHACLRVSWAYSFTWCGELTDPSFIL